MNTILIGRCNDDRHVSFPFLWAEIVKKEAHELGIQVVDIRAEDYTEANVAKLIVTSNPEFIFLSGHGLGWCLQGHGRSPILIANKNHHLLKDKVAYILSCFTAQYLGQLACGHGCTAYIGYTDEFAFYPMFPKNPTTEDKFAFAFMESSNAVPLTIIKGGTPEDAYKNSQETFQKWLNYWQREYKNMKKGTTSGQMIDTIIGMLLVDKEGQVLIPRY